MNLIKITTKIELEKYPIGTYISYLNTNNILKTGGYIIKYADKYFIYITDVNIKYRATYSHIKKIFIDENKHSTLRGSVNPIDPIIPIESLIMKKSIIDCTVVQPSSEQSVIIKAIKNNMNVVTDAVAGSGKTTTVLYLAKSCPNKKIIQVTYNSQLKHEVREKVQKANIKNLEIHTYHSIAVKYYDQYAHTDENMQRIIKTNLKPKNKLPLIDIFVLDEVQDMTMLYYCLINKIITDSGREIIILLLGDHCQAIYGFKGADVRFLTLGCDLWQNHASIIKLPLRTSYRVTNAIAAFVNDVMIGHKRIISNKTGKRVYYIQWNIWNVHAMIGDRSLNLNVNV